MCVYIYIYSFYNSTLVENVKPEFKREYLQET